jgi:hypothetical protein
MITPPLRYFFLVLLLLLSSEQILHSSTVKYHRTSIHHYCGLTIEKQALDNQDSDTTFDAPRCFIPKRLPKGKKGNQLLGVRPTTEFSEKSPSGRFKIHYDTTGSNAVNRTDLNKNDLPDYIDSVMFYMDSAYNFEVNTLGFPAPPFDVVDNTSYDVYVVQLGKGSYSFLGDIITGTYGVTFAEDDIRTACGYKSTAFMFLDNDYSERDTLVPGSRNRTYRDTGIVALKITAFHEFHHFIQLGIRNNVGRWFMEMTSVWIEQHAFPSILNFQQYVRPVFRNSQEFCLSCSRSLDGSYGHGIFLEMIAKSKSPTIIRDTWQRIGTCSEPFGALDTVLSQSSSSLKDTWCTAMDWAYYTGYRADKNRYFDSASTYPILDPDNNVISNQKFTAPSFNRTISLYPFQFKLLRVLLPRDISSTNDTVDFLVTNTNSKEFNSGGGPTQDFTLTVSNEPFQGSKQLGSLSYHYSMLLGDDLCVKEYNINGFSTTTPGGVFPEPFKPSRGDQILHLPVPNGISIDAMVEVELISPEGFIFLRRKLPITLLDNKARVVSVNLSDNEEVQKTMNSISSGVYLYTVTSGEINSIGKFSVVR